MKTFTVLYRRYTGYACERTARCWTTRARDQWHARSLFINRRTLGDRDMILSVSEGGR